MSAKLLLVDDEPGVRQAVQMYLEAEGFRVQTASSAAEAWDALQHLTPDLIITDIMMPQVDGYSFLAKLRGDARFQAIPVIFLTAKGMSTDRIQGYQAGCDAYLPKPFNPVELVAVIENLLQRRLPQSPTEPDLNRLDDRVRRIESLLETLLNDRKPVATMMPPIALNLTAKEQVILNWVAAGLMNKEIATRTSTSIRNVEKHISHLFIKTGTNSRTELVRFALEHGLVK